MCKFTIEILVIKIIVAQIIIIPIQPSEMMIICRFYALFCHMTGRKKGTMYFEKQNHLSLLKGRFLKFRKYNNFANLFSKLSESTLNKEISKFQ